MTATTEVNGVGVALAALLKAHGFDSAEAIAVPSHTNARPPVKRVQKIVQQVTARKSVP